MSKSHSFSIYLLKPDFNVKNTLKEDSNLKDNILAEKVPKNSTPYVLDELPKQPWWRSYFGIKKELTQTLKGALVFLPVENRVFVITFGNVIHNIKPESYEYDFGLRVTLNSVDPDKLKSLDSLQPNNARRQRTQLSVGSDLSLFDFDRYSTILRSLTGAVKENLKENFRQISGASNVRLSSKVEPDKLPELCTELLKLYNDDSYKKSFPDIQSVMPVKDPILLKNLNDNLVKAITSKNENVILTIPEIVNYAEEMYVTFQGKGKSLVYSDVSIDRYYEYLEDKGYELATLDLDMLKKNDLAITDELGQPKREKYSIFKCLIFDSSTADSFSHFHLCEGNWYEINKDYITNLIKYLDPLCAETSLPVYNHNEEASYNEACVKGNNIRLCLDRSNIAPKGQRQVEPCDILEIDGDQIILHHVKISTSSSTLSHLFNQGLNSIKLLRGHDEAFNNLSEIITEKAAKNQSNEFLTVLKSKKFKVVFQIITDKNKTKKSLNLPLFSRISLQQTMQELRLMNIDGEYCFVDNQKKRQKGKKKQSKKKTIVQPKS